MPEWTRVSVTPAIELTGVSKTYGNVTALSSTTLRIWPGEIIAVLGPAGSGKSTLLALIAGLELPSHGRIRLLGRTALGPGPDRAVVFQEPSLLPWLTVKQNVMEALIGAQPALSHAAQSLRAERALDRGGLSELAGRKPASLTIGQQQQVAIVRAFAVMPKVLLLDRPFGLLDPAARRAMHTELLRLLAREDNSVWNVVLVTNDIDEALLFADRVIILTGGPDAVREDLRVNRDSTEETQAQKRHLEQTLGILTD